MTPPAAKEPGVFIHSCSGDERIYVFAEHGPPQCGLTPTAANFNAIVTYEDGCQKSTWRNFHENGHQHVCVCGQSVKHEGLPDLNARCLVTPAAKEPEEVASSVFNRGCNCDGVDIGVGTMHEPRCGTPTPEDVADLIRAEREKAQERRDAAYREGLEDGLAKETSELVAQARATALEEAAKIADTYETERDKQAKAIVLRSQLPERAMWTACAGTAAGIASHIRAMRAEQPK